MSSTQSTTRKAAKREKVYRARMTRKLTLRRAKVEAMLKGEEAEVKMLGTRSTGMLPWRRSRSGMIM